MMKKTYDRSVNWFESAHRYLNGHFSSLPSVQGRSALLTLRLCALLFERLPSELSEDLFYLLPDESREQLRGLQQYFNGPGETSIGYPDFLEKVSLTLGESTVSEDVIREIADAFLWSIAHEIPADLKGEISRRLPAELTIRMDLYSAVDQAKVA